jgi:membrane-associated protein
MELAAQLLDVLIHLDRYLGVFLHQYGVWIYLLLFLIVFAETGLVITPFLPGDSLLFVTGTLAATGGLELGWLMAVLCAAAILGDSVNYSIGKYLGPRVFQWDDTRLFKREHLVYTQRFYERHGGKTIVLARFIPVVRTFAPFVAGIGRMAYARFAFYNVFGAVLWVVSLVLAGYYFGNLPLVKQNLTLVILGIIVLSIMPGVIEYLRHRSRS